jgi:hypothetical protein
MNKILSKAPKQYLFQQFLHCGGFTVKAVLSAYGLDDKKSPKEYHANPVMRFLGAATVKDLVKEIEKKGLTVTKENVHRKKDEEKLNAIKNLLKKDIPVIIPISGGYNHNGEYSKLAGTFLGHYISIWGFDDEKKVFYIYDSYIRGNEDTLPIGNVERSYKDLLRDWKGPLHHKLLGYDYLYLAICEYY